jgi:Major tropism determinant N-terminal domain
MSVQIKLRRDTAANWTTVNPVLGEGEPGLESDTGKIKYGNGTDHWNSLDYPTVYATPTPVSALTGTTLPINITQSSLTQLGTLTNLTVTNPIHGSINGNAATADLATLASTATSATTAVTANVATTLAGGAANQIVFQTGTGNIDYIVAPASSSTFLEWNGVTFSWATAPSPTADSLGGTTLASTVINSSLTSVGTLANLTVTNPIIGSVTGSAGSVAAINITGASLPNTITGSSLTSVGTLVNLSVTNPIAGSITGTAANINGPATTGTPTNTSAPASWFKVTVGSNTYYMPLYQ